MYSLSASCRLGRLVGCSFQNINRVRALCSSKNATSNNSKPWEDPWKHALPPQDNTYTDVEELDVDWKYVQRLMPHDVVPELPKHSSYPTPSGWKPPACPPPSLPYYVRRKRDHTFALYLERRRDQLNEKTLDFEYAELVVVRGIDGDVFAFENDLRTFLESNLGKPVASHVDELKGRVKVKGAERSLIEQFLFEKVFMPAAAGCTNCRTKYNLLTREVGCPSCGLSFCKKCLGYKTRSPRQGNQLVPVCYECYQRGEEAKLKNPALPVQTVSSNKETTGNAVISNWWGEGLPPPSLRQQLGTNPAPSKKVTAPVLPHQSQSNPPQNSKINFEKELGDRLTELKDEGRSEQLPSISNLEERLAALRGCDVELVRNPRLWFSNNEPTINAESSDALIEQAQGLAMIEEKYDLDKALIERVNKLHEKDQTMKTDVSNCPDPRFSTVSDADSLMMNAEERTQFEKILNEAEEENKKILARKENVDEELKDVMKITKQRSEELQKIQTEFTKFWDKQIHKTIEDDSENDEDIDDEMLKKIMKEAEETPDIPDEKGKTQQNESSPKKGFLRNFFKK